MKHTTRSNRGVFAAWLVLLGVSCAGAQRPTLDQAKAGLALACDALAFAVAEGKTIPGAELADRVCDVERTAAVMQRLADSREPPREIITEPPEWLDAGAK